MADKKPIGYQVVFESQEAVELFRFYADAYNECDIDHEALCKIVAQGEEFKKGMKKLLLKLKGKCDPLLRS